VEFSLTGGRERERKLRSGQTCFDARNVTVRPGQQQHGEIFTKLQLSVHMLDSADTK